VMQKTGASSFAHLMKMAMVLREDESEEPSASPPD